MLYANVNGQKLRATPGANALCPGCGGGVVARCGEINVWHWAHLSGDCDPWHEPESAWHLEWKSIAPPERCEVRMGCHRADIVAPSGFIIELQHSPLEPSQVRERESFYGDHLIWVVDASGFLANLSLRNRGDYWSFRWKWPRKWQFAITRPLAWDMGDGRLFHVKKLHPNKPERLAYNREGRCVGTLPAKPCGGWGVFFDRPQFIAGHFDCSGSPAELPGEEASP